MDDDDPIRRMAGMISWKVRRKDHKLGRPMTYDEAVAYAHSHEPQLSDKDMADALYYAQCAAKFKEVCKAAPPGMTIKEIAQHCGLPVK